MTRKIFLSWLPAVLLMVAIFVFSSIPSTQMPLFGGWDVYVKKGGHMLGYGLLATSYWYAMRFKKRDLLVAFLLTIVYALSDEYHQSFVPGRHASLVDAFGFDGGGAAIALALAYLWQLRRDLKTKK